MSKPEAMVRARERARKKAENDKRAAYEAQVAAHRAEMEAEAASKGMRIDWRDGMAYMRSKDEPPRTRIPFLGDWRF